MDAHLRSARSIQRDLESLRSFLSNEMLGQDVVYDRAAGGYRLTKAAPKGLTNGEILAVCKILLESRSMRRDEMLPIRDKLVDCCVPEKNRRAVQRMIGNEKLSSRIMDGPFCRDSGSWGRRCSKSACWSSNIRSSRGKRR